MSEITERIAAIRAFNRFYTRVIGLLDEGIMKSPYSLAEARVIYEIGRLDRTTSAVLARALCMDPGQLSRLVARLTQKHVLAATPHPEDGRAADLALTASGKTASVELNELSDKAAAELLAPLAPSQQKALAAAMATISTLLGETPQADTSLRGHRIGDLGWLIHRQAMIYHEEQGWNGEFEALIARIYAEYEEAAETPPKRQRIAERHGAIAGSIFILSSQDDPRLAQLRMLYVEPWARGTGLGHRLVGEAIAFARVSGYARIKLWTQDCLVAARKVYQAAGFVLVRQERHHSFGKDLNGQYWERDL